MRFDPRLWNIIPLTACLAGCKPADAIPLDETGTGEGDGDGDPSGDGDGDPTTTGDGDGDPSTSTGDGDGDEYAYPDCFGYNSGDAQCELGSICEPDSGDCFLLEPLADCEAPALIEIPLADAAQGTIFDLSFADLDGDGVDELLVLHPGTLIVVDGGTSTSYPVDIQAEKIVTLHVDHDEHLDVLLSSSAPNHTSVLLGVGDGSLLPPTSRTLIGIQRPAAIDWGGEGGDELAAVDADWKPHLIEGLDGTEPLVQEFPLPLPFPTINLANAFHPGDYDGDGVRDVLIQDAHGPDGQLCGMFAVSPTAGFLFGSHLPISVGENHWCRAIGVPRTVDPAWAVVFTVEYGSTIELRMIEGLLEFPYARHVGGGITSGNLADLARIDGLGLDDGLSLILAMTSGTSLVQVNDAGFGCRADLEGPPASARVIVGNFTDNEGDEFATLSDAGVVQMWGRAP